MADKRVFTSKRSLFWKFVEHLPRLSLSLSSNRLANYKSCFNTITKFLGIQVSLKYKGIKQSAMDQMDCIRFSADG